MSVKCVCCGAACEPDGDLCGCGRIVCVRCVYACVHCHGLGSPHHHLVPHTPGPWDWYGPTRGEGLTFTHEAHVGPGEGNESCGPIAAVSGDDDGQAVANARLIAAAPDLLAACEAALEFVRRQRMGSGNVEPDLAAAIAKAKGGAA